MIIIKRLERYDTEVTEAMRMLLIELSRSGKDKGPIGKEWISDVISSPWHDVLLAVEYKDGDRTLASGERLVGMASVSVVMGAGIEKNAYLEDFVVASQTRGKGVGSLLWSAVLEWGKEKGCKRLEFTSGRGREKAQRFYLNRGAEIYDTNFFRYNL